MAGQNRNITVLIALIASMTVGALVLMALDHRGPSAGAYSLSSYLRLDPVEDIVKNTVTAAPARWTGVEVTYSQTDGGNVKDLPLLTGLTDGGTAEFHFVVCNGNGADDGQVQASDFWKKQQMCQKGGLIRICVISNSDGDSVTDCQLQRTDLLIENLCRTFEISPRRIHYPAQWRM